MQDREAVLREQEIKVKDRANRIKGELSHSGETTKTWRVRNMQEGAIARKRRLQNDWIRSRNELDDLKAKKMLINDRHRSFRPPHSKPGDSKGD